MELLLQITDKVLFLRPKGQCLRIKEAHGHGGAVCDRAADTVQPLRILFRNTDADGNIVSLAHGVKDGPPVTDIQQICVSVEAEDFQCIVVVNMGIGNKRVFCQIINIDILRRCQRVIF